ncbi:hypothetical protein ALP38_101309 [Pseudomonas amygdali pv. sesami]|nr:hypothetical protein ALP38_101309 [Pseudomonas amygdali pv. sesami]RMU02439.1 hypothetical protein ALP37_101429 [Pseudomonas amygdali pv. sesami]RMV87837.1 hypothetical protein ALP04_101494 [Pseudomonas amygdali pv. sesami]
MERRLRGRLTQQFDLTASSHRPATNHPYYNIGNRLNLSTGRFD